jgi:electron transport complex protein RnfB
VAVIDEEICIGCAKCLPVCPVDAIVGAKRQLHTVITQECSGCALCLPACPVDCIRLEPLGDATLAGEALERRARQYRARYEAHQHRLAMRSARRAAELAARSSAGSPA